MDMSAAEFKRAALAQPQSSPSQSSAAELNGSEILVRCLQAEGVRHLWGYPGGAVLYIYDALYKQNSMSRPPCMQPTVSPAPAARSAWRWSLRARVSPMP